METWFDVAYKAAFSISTIFTIFTMWMMISSQANLSPGLLPTDCPLWFSFPWNPSPHRLVLTPGGQNNHPMSYS